MISIKRAYEKPEEKDGMRILVDRLWPRGVAKENGKIDLWVKDIAPSSELRKQFNHEPEKWEWFKKSYFSELDKNREAVAELRNTVRGKTVTFVYSAKEDRYNNAAALKEYFNKTEY